MARTGKKKVWRRKPRASAQNTGTGSSAPAPVHPTPKVWRPGVDGLEKDEELQYDPSAYDALHAFHLGWPCLSFDIVRDSLGALRHEFPHTLYCVAGTQADISANNVIAVVKLSNVTGQKRTPNRISHEEDEGGSESESDDSDDDEQEMVDSDEPSKLPKLEERFIPHQGCINRIRAMQQQPHIIATWADTGYVQVWDVALHLNSLATKDTSENKRIPQPPLQLFKGHKDEGFALDWSPTTVGRLVSGDCKSAIHLWEPTPGGKWNVGSSQFLGHSASVEDLQWSPSEVDVFASCSVDKTIGIWDTRSRRQAISVKAHDADVNVISWNRLVNFMLASGADDGTFRIWDLRSLKDVNNDGSFVAHFKYHNAYITSLEWSPHESSTLAVTSADNQLTMWDFSLERDTEEEAQYQREIGRLQAEAPEDLPPQLLFSHQGQKDMKELHWHPQIHGLIVSTAGDGFNVFKASNI